MNEKTEVEHKFACVLRLQQFCPVLSCVVASCAESLGISYLLQILTQLLLYWTGWTLIWSSGQDLIR